MWFMAGTQVNLDLWVLQVTYRQLREFKQVCPWAQVACINRSITSTSNQQQIIVYLLYNYAVALIVCSCTRLPQVTKIIKASEGQSIIMTTASTVWSLIIYYCIWIHDCEGQECNIIIIATSTIYTINCMHMAHH